MLPWALQEADTQLRAARLREAEQEAQLEAAQDQAKQSAEQSAQLQQVLRYCEDGCRCSKQYRLQDVALASCISAGRDTSCEHACSALWRQRMRQTFRLA
jgi:hypothetical protein